MSNTERISLFLYTVKAGSHEPCWFYVPWARTVPMGRVHEPWHSSALIEYFKRNFPNKINKFNIKILFFVTFYPLRYT